MEVLFERSYRVAEIEAVASALLPFIRLQPNVLFKGEVGAGKTTLIKSLTKLLGVESEVTSPTFALVNDYEVKGISIHHFDLYRLESLDELLNIGWEEYLESGNWLWVEWPEIVPEAFDDSFQLIELSKGVEEDLRTVVLRG